MADHALGHLRDISRANNSGAPQAGKTLGRVVAPGDETGHSTLAGTLTVAGTPARRRVRLYHRASGRLVREVFSDAKTGAYVFRNISAGPWQVIGLDDFGLYDPEARDWLDAT